MSADLVQYRVAAARIEIGADAREVYRCADECLAHAESFGSEVISPAVVVDKANRLVLAAVVIELGGDDLAVGHEFAVLPDLLELHVEIVACANVENEVHVPGKDARDVHDNFVGQAGRSGALEQRRLDDAVRESFALLDRPLDDFRGEARFLPVNFQCAREIER